MFLKKCQNLFIQMSGTLFTRFHNTFLMEAVKIDCHVVSLSQTGSGAKLHMSVLDTFTIITNHLVE